MRHRRLRPIHLTVVSALCYTCALGLGGCGRLIQNNIEVVFAPEVIENAFLLPTTLVFRLFGNLLS